MNRVENNNYYFIVHTLKNHGEYVLSNPVQENNLNREIMNMAHIIKWKNINKNPTFQDFHVIKSHMNPIEFEFLKKQKQKQEIDIGVVLNAKLVILNSESNELEEDDYLGLMKDTESNMLLVKTSSAVIMYYQVEDELFKKEIIIDLSFQERLFRDLKEGFKVTFRSIFFNAMDHDIKEEIIKQLISPYCIEFKKNNYLIISENEKNKFFKKNRNKNIVRKDIIFLIGIDDKGKTNLQRQRNEIERYCKEKGVSYQIVGDGKNKISYLDLANCANATTLIIYGHGNVKNDKHYIDLLEYHQATDFVLSKVQDITGFKNTIIASCYSGHVVSDIKNGHVSLLPGSSIVCTSGGENISFMRDNKFIIFNLIDLCAQKRNSIIEMTQCMIMSVPQIIVFGHIPVLEAPGEKILSKSIREPKKLNDIFVKKIEKLRYFLLADFNSFINDSIKRGYAIGLSREFHGLNISVDENKYLEGNYKKLMEDKSDQSYHKKQFLDHYTRNFTINIINNLNYKMLDFYLNQIRLISLEQNKNRFSAFKRKHMGVNPLTMIGQAMNQAVGLTSESHEVTVRQFQNILELEADKCLTLLLEIIDNLINNIYSPSKEYIKNRDVITHMLASIVNNGANLFMRKENSSFTIIEWIDNKNQPELIYAIMGGQNNDKNVSPLNFLLDRNRHNENYFARLCVNKNFLIEQWPRISDENKKNLKLLAEKNGEFVNIISDHIDNLYLSQKMNLHASTNQSLNQYGLFQLTSKTIRHDIHALQKIQNYLIGSPSKKPKSFY